MPRLVKRACDCSTCKARMREESRDLLAAVFDAQAERIASDLFRDYSMSAVQAFLREPSAEDDNDGA